MGLYVFYFFFYKKAYLWLIEKNTRRYDDDEDVGWDK